MDISCHKCGQSVEEGIPFCPHCSAPQIRVILAEPPAQAVLATEPASSIPTSQAGTSVALSVAWSAAFRPCMVAAVIASILMFSGLYPVISMISGGFLAVLFYRQRWPASAIKPAGGMRLGALSGLLWFAVSAVIATTFTFLLHKGPEIRDWLLQRIDQAKSSTADPQTLAMLERFKTPDGLQVLMVFLLVFFFVASIALGALGGAIGGALLGRNNRR